MEATRHSGQSDPTIWEAVAGTIKTVSSTTLARAGNFKGSPYTLWVAVSLTLRIRRGYLPPPAAGSCLGVAFQQKQHVRGPIKGAMLAAPWLGDLCEGGRPETVVRDTEVPQPSGPGSRDRPLSGLH